MRIKSGFVTFNCDSKTHLTQNEQLILSTVRIEYLPAACPSAFLSNVLKISTSYGLWKPLVRLSTVSVLSHACQPAVFDSGYNTWEYRQYVDLCLSWDYHFITSFSHHIDSGLFPSPWQSKSGPGPSSYTMEQCYKMKPNRPSPCKWFYLWGTILLWIDMIRCSGHDRYQLCSVIQEQ